MNIPDYHLWGFHNWRKITLKHLTILFYKLSLILQDVSHLLHAVFWSLQVAFWLLNMFKIQRRPYATIFMSLYSTLGGKTIVQRFTHMCTLVQCFIMFYTISRIFSFRKRTWGHITCSKHDSQDYKRLVYDAVLSISYEHSFLHDNFYDFVAIHKISYQSYEFWLHVVLCQLWKPHKWTIVTRSPGISK